MSQVPLFTLANSGQIRPCLLALKWKRATRRNRANGNVGLDRDPAWRESRGALRRQGAGVVTSLPCPRETAAEREVSKLGPDGERGDARAEVQEGSTVIPLPWVEKTRTVASGRPDGEAAKGKWSRWLAGKADGSKVGAVAGGTKKKGPAAGLPEGAASVDRAGGKDALVRDFRSSRRERRRARTRGDARSRSTEGLKMVCSRPAGRVKDRTSVVSSK